VGKANDEDLIVMQDPSKQQNGMIRTITTEINTHIVFLDDDVIQPSNYRDVIQCLATCNEHDTVNMLVNSYGGRTDSIWQIIEAMKGCRGEVAVTVIGAAYSAASMLVCMAPQCIIADSAEFMLHTAHYGSVGTVPNVKSQTDFATRQLNKLLDTAYTGFLTPREMEELKKGREFWFDADEARKRIQRRYRHLRNQSKPKKIVVDTEVSEE
jgi:ATP-dependent protease ClpP protease subunit